MGVLDIFSRMTRKPDLMDRMMLKLELREATIRCLSCDNPDACAAWLDDRVARAEAPAYCRNHDFLADLKRRPELSSRRTG